MAKIVYKYLEAEHLQPMLQTGRLRVGTLHEYRDTETHDSEIGDPDEGRKTQYENPLFMSYDTPETISDFAAEFIGRTGPARSLFYDNTFELDHDLPDFFLYCVSKEASRDAMLRMGKDVCVKVEDAEAFFFELDAELRRRLLVAGDPAVAECIYRPRRREYNPADHDHPAVLKEPRHSYQAEVRGIWNPASRPIAPQIIDVPRIRGMVTLVCLGISA